MNVVIIGHVDHSKTTLTAAICTILAMREDTVLIVGDETEERNVLSLENIDEVKLHELRRNHIPDIVIEEPKWEHYCFQVGKKRRSYMRPEYTGYKERLNKTYQGSQKQLSRNKRHLHAQRK
jgi:hypothetical protein